ncbi:hypothetical protein D0Y60_16710 [Shinella sp. WSJ-2]|uniref:hypothetical protein n=1 Tax=Shinella sp. WSJ-2 TaxID=2303749 RepID=UPI000E3D9497|nr:hypothetical protein [Shinella sp. WSJ-2]RFZ86619.1 hypothetical protein D0Y60_16710 [Shinella sp. WSJ-2]
MDTEVTELPRLDFKLAGPSYFLGTFTLGILLAGVLSKVIHALMPGYPSIGMVLGLVAAIIILPISVFWGLKSISKIDLDKPALSIDRDGIHIHDVRVLDVPRKTVAFIAWEEISKIQYQVSGRFNETKHIIIESQTVGPNGLWIAANKLTSVNPRDLFETMRHYRRTITPPPADDPRLKVYDSLSWTGLDDEG